MKRAVLTVFALAILCTAFLAGRSFAQKPPNALIVEVPSDMEPNNPVAMTMHWDRGNQSFYYFSWGEHSTGGYRLEYEGFVKNVMTVKAIGPGADQMVAQVLTYPKLLLKLPKGSYNYRIVDAKGNDITSKFNAGSGLVNFNIKLPVNGSMTTRRIWRAQTPGKNRAEIALAALYAQPEMAKYAETNVKKVELLPGKCGITVPKDFSKLTRRDKEELTRAIRGTVLGLKLKDIQTVDLTVEQ